MTSSALASALARFPRLGLARLPTPLEPMTRLSARLGGPRIWVKREDETGVGFGGNKLRKLDFVLAEALADGADTIVSGGVVQSNSQRQVAAAAAKLGLTCHLAVYHGRLTPPTPEYERSGNALLNRLFGARLHDVPWTGDRNAAIEGLAARLRERASGHISCLMVYRTHSARSATHWRSWKSPSSRTRPGRPKSIVHCFGSGGNPGGACRGRRPGAFRASILSGSISIRNRTRVRADVVTYGRAAAALLEYPGFERGGRGGGRGPCRPGIRRAASRDDRGHPVGRHVGGAARSIRSIPAKAWRD